VATKKWGLKIQWKSMKGATCLFGPKPAPRYKAIPKPTIEPPPKLTRPIETKSRAILRLGFQEVPFKTLLRKMDRSILDKARSIWGKTTRFSYSHGGVYYSYNPELRLASRSRKNLRSDTLRARIPVTIYFRDQQSRTKVSEAAPITSGISKASSYWHYSLFCWKIEGRTICREKETKRRRKNSKGMKKGIKRWAKKTHYELEETAK
jgi:hypothetical protein